MGHTVSATGLANLARSDHADAIARLDLIVYALAGVLIILAMWDWLKRRD